MLLHVLQKVTDTSVSLLSAGLDLRGRQHEAIRTLIAELGSEDVVGLDDFVDIIDAAAGSLVDGLADAAGDEGGAVDGTDRSRGAARQGEQL